MLQKEINNFLGLNEPEFKIAERIEKITNEKCIFFLFFIF